MPTYSYRPFQPGDEKSINVLYATITGIKRSPQAYFWQWLQAPGGAGEIWLIEVDEGDGDKKLIGHHGVMPIRFSCGKVDLLFGKTENTFVHPDFRRKILYPRFEGRFRSVYESRFEALFSTTGPEEAIRQRKAQGYDFPAVWKTFTWATRIWSDLSYLISKFANKFNPPAGISSETDPKENFLGTSKFSNVTITNHDVKTAKDSNFFHSFWPSTRQSYGITPSRDREDLKWRFWDNPYVSYYTLVLDSVTLGSGFAMLYSHAPGLMKIEEFVVEYPRSPAYGGLLGAVIEWAANQGAYSVQFTTTDQSINWVGWDNFKPRKRRLIVQEMIRIHSRAPEQRMPIKITEKGRITGLIDREWYVTPIVFQGID
jgi:hypothetical protein